QVPGLEAALKNYRRIDASFERAMRDVKTPEQMVAWLRNLDDLIPDGMKTTQVPPNSLASFKGYQRSLKEKDQETAAMPGPEGGPNPADGMPGQPGRRPDGQPGVPGDRGPGENPPEGMAGPHDGGSGRGPDATPPASPRTPSDQDLRTADKIR